MGDLYCKKCGEPWEAAGVLPALNGREDEADMSKKEAERFMKGEGCPSCGFGKYCPLCKGTGEIDEEEAEWWGEEVEPIDIRDDIMYFRCPKCGGTGKPRGKDELYYSRLVDVDGEVDVLDYIF